MRIIVTDPAGKKHTISVRAKNRLELKREIGAEAFLLKGNRYHVNDAVAEPDHSNIVAGLVLGFLLGCMGTWIGILIGVGIGGMIGSSMDMKEERSAEYFNELKL